MTDLLKLILGVPASLFRSRAKLEAENLVLRQQINVLRRQAEKRLHLNNTDRFLLAQIERQIEKLLDRVVEVGTDSVMRAFEKWIARLERQALVLHERSRNAERPKQPFDELFELAIQFLANLQNCGLQEKWNTEIWYFD